MYRQLPPAPSHSPHPSLSRSVTDSWIDLTHSSSTSPPPSTSPQIRRRRLLRRVSNPSSQPLTFDQDAEYVDTSPSGDESEDLGVITAGLRVNNRPPPPTLHASSSDSSLASSIELERNGTVDIARFIAQMPLGESGVLGSSVGTSTASSSEGGSPGSESDADEAEDDDTRTVLAAAGQQRKRKSDEALRASLSTILSCAAAAGGRGETPGKAVGVGGTVPAAGLTIIRESTTISSGSAESPVGSSVEGRGKKGKRGTGVRKRLGAEMDGERRRKVLYGVLGAAGVVVVLSVVSFGMGVWVGREMGREEVRGLGRAAGGRA